MNAALVALLRAIPQLAEGPVLRVLAKSILVTVILFAAMGAALWYLLTLAFAGWDQSTAAELSGLLAILLTVIGGWLLFRLIALLVLQFFAEEIVAAVEARHYPQARQSLRDRPFLETLGDSLRALARALLVNLAVLPFALVLLITGFGAPLLFWLANSWLVGRELTEMVWFRHRAARSDAVPISGVQRFALGGFIAALMAIPLVNLLAPVLGAAAATHLVHRRIGAANHA